MVRKFFFVLVLAFACLFFLASATQATPPGKVDCGIWDSDAGTCRNCNTTVNCNQGCTSGCDCSSNCDGGEGDDGGTGDVTCYPKPEWNCPAGYYADFDALQPSDYGRCRISCLFANPDLANPCCTGNACSIIESNCRYNAYEEWVCDLNHAQAPCVSDCGSVTAPTGISVTRNSYTSATINWTPGNGGTHQQLIRMGANKQEVENGCPGQASPACVVKASTPAYTPPGNPPSPQNMYYYKKDVRQCVSTSSQYSDIATCETNLDLYVSGNTTQTCFLSMSACETYSTDTWPVNNLALGTVYYARIVNFKDAACYANSVPNTTNYLSSCTLSPTSIAVKVGDSPQTLTAQVNSSAEIQRVDFSSDSTSIASVAPSSDSSWQYQTSVTAHKVGTTTARDRVFFTGPVLACESSVPVNVTSPGPWWQVKDSDIQSMGDIASDVITGEFFDLAGTGGYPGVVAYTGSAAFGSGSVSSVGWLARSTSTSAKIYNYNFFASQIPADTVITTVPSNSVNGSFFASGGILSHGYYWYKYDGTVSGLDLTINGATNLNSRKVILLVEGADLNIGGNINVLDGSGFFGSFVEGNISVDPAVGGGTPNLEGIYLADGSFSTGAGTSQLYVRGSVAAYGGVSLQRDLGDNNSSTPAELFEYAPDQILLFPAKLGYRRINWKEVAP